VTPARAAKALPFLLFGSGFCALVYQTMWLRELRSVFGASTPATAAVLAVFMAGLGVGGVLFGARAERSSRPLRLYALLELGIAAGAALSPVLVHVGRIIYYALGGSTSLSA
jgi:spermidine synthase